MLPRGNRLELELFESLSFESLRFESLSLLLQPLSIITLPADWLVGRAPYLVITTRSDFVLPPIPKLHGNNFNQTTASAFPTQ